jgi:UTP--glucose-1-phosphate uridylyltransferase
LIGWQLANAAAVGCEVVDKVAGDRGGIPARLDDKLVILEEFRLPEDFDPETVRVFNTNTFHFAARALLELHMNFTYFAVKKQVDDQPVIQFERLLGEVTSTLRTSFVRVPRTGTAARFLPVKDTEELEQRRGEIEAALRARGVLT